MKRRAAGNLGFRFGRPGRRPGFTLLEAVLVLLVMGVVAGVVMLRNSMTNTELIGESDLLKSRLRYTQNLSLNGNDAYRWGIRFAKDGYTLFKVNRTSGASADQKFPQDQVVGYTFPTGTGITIESVGAAAAAKASSGSVTYDQWGSPGSSDVAITMKQGGDQRKIVVKGVTGFVE